MKKYYYVRQFSKKSLIKILHGAEYTGIRNYFKHNELVSTESCDLRNSKNVICVSKNGLTQAVMAEDLRETPWLRKKGLNMAKGGIKCIDQKKK